jgi:hypothetical protein
LLHKQEAVDNAGEEGHDLGHVTNARKIAATNKVPKNVVDIKKPASFIYKSAA